MENAKIHTPRDPANAGEPTYTPATDRPVLGHHGDPDAEYAALKEGAAVVDLPHKTVLRLTGKDPLGMLGAVLTNKVPEEESLGAYALLLNNKGRVQADLRVLKDTGGVLVVTEPEGAEAAKELLGRYAPFSRVKLEDLSEGEAPWSVLGLYGPRAKSLLGELHLAEHETAEVDLGGSPDAAVLVAGVAVPVPGFDLFGPAGAIDAAHALLVERGAVPAGLHAYETARIEAGVPRYGSDVTTENFPAEAGLLDRAVSFEKGCYPGQETVARMRYRGHPNKTLHRLAVEGPAPEVGTPVFQGEKKVGTVTSVAALPVDGRTLALGYLHRNIDIDGSLRAGEAFVSPVGDNGWSVDGIKPAEECESIEDVRRGIDSLGRRIVALIGHRARYVDAAAGFKKNASDVRAAERRSAMMDERRGWAEEEGLSPDMVEDLYELLVNHFVDREMEGWRTTRPDRRI